MGATEGGAVLPLRLRNVSVFAQKDRVRWSTNGRMVAAGVINGNEEQSGTGTCGSDVLLQSGENKHDVNGQRSGDASGVNQGWDVRALFPLSAVTFS